METTIENGHMGRCGQKLCITVPLTSHRKTKFWTMKLMTDLLKDNLSQHMTKPTKWPVRSAKSQISLGIWSAVHSMGSWGSNVSSCGQWRLWSDWADTQADLSLCWMHMLFCWFCPEAAQFFKTVIAKITMQCFLQIMLLFLEFYFHHCKKIHISIHIILL